MEIIKNGNVYDVLFYIAENIATIITDVKFLEIAAILVLFSSYNLTKEKGE